MQWFLAIVGLVIFILILFCLPETLRERKSITAIAETGTAPQDNPIEDEKSGAPADAIVRPTLTRTTTRQSVHVKTTKYFAYFKRAIIDPLRIILYLQFPAVAICVFYATTTFAALYSLNVSIQQTFSAKPYNYPSIIVGTLYIPNSLGYFITSIFGGKWVDRIMAREARKAGRYDRKGRLQYRPEDRMKENACKFFWVESPPEVFAYCAQPFSGTGALMFPAALVVYGWTTKYGVNTAAPMVANFFFGIGSMLVFAMGEFTALNFVPRHTRAHGSCTNRNASHHHAHRVHAAERQPRRGIE